MIFYTLSIYGNCLWKKQKTKNKKIKNSYLIEKSKNYL